MESTKDGKQVDVLLRSTIRHEGQEAESHELESAGEITVKAGKTFLRFEENQNGQQVRTIVKLDAADAFIMRSGAVQMRLPFTPDELRPGTYGNGPASFNLLVKTGKLEVTDERFTVHYELHAEGALLGKHELTIHYTEGQS
ncbi:DUF1934 domain-containing protein [Sporosarcina oncorhynchi]|uniref:DUF1934 domain-containing protein n=1 Tax=Sporosarcina oncorhynchi TaxID=3056444 RepID=A0ABZ0L924_9BACL|nr:DUF1934 domain-containing protein [Sporosarcina sp. T2O-4]WOV87949.1 DUF1934 domain-containing protein [Sporosarcina sp. T2O-4]